MTKSILFICLISAFLCLIPQCYGEMSESERVAKFYENNYSWPNPKFKPNEPGWGELMQRRLDQAGEIDDKALRWEAYAQTMSAAVVQDNYTEFGFGLARAPDDLMEALRQGVRDGVAKGPREEKKLNLIVGPNRPWFVDRPDLTDRVLNELKNYPQAWAGMELHPEIAYGFRLYRNESRLFVHADRPETHVISFILHIDSSDDAEDWPILIEDFKGRTHEVVLTSGDILFYESSKCFHGRPRPFKGSWYSSVFVHYSPKHGYKENVSWKNRVIAIPPNWDEPKEIKNHVPLDIHGTSFDEPSCPNGWCATEDSIKWSGPGEEGYLIAPNGEKFPFDPNTNLCLDKHVRCSKWASMETNECERNKGYMHHNCPKSCKVCGEEGQRDEL